MRVGAELYSLIIRCRNLQHMYQIHGFMIRRGVDRDLIFVSHLIAASSSLGFSNYAYSLLSQHQPTSTTNNNNNLSLYNTFIISSTSPPCAAIFLFTNLASSSSYAFNPLLNSQLHSQTIHLGLSSHPHITTSLIHMYSSSSSILDARKLFDESSSSTSSFTLSLWNAMLSAYAKDAHLDNATHLFETMPLRNVISWTTMITAFLRFNRPHQAISCFRSMLLQNVHPDHVSLLLALSASARLGSLPSGFWIHNYILKHPPLTSYPPLKNALIHMYAKCGNIRMALQVFHYTHHKTIVTWTTIIAGLASHGLGKQALHFYSRMDLQPNHLTFLAILSACAHSGFIQLARFYFNTMTSKHGIHPNIQHYGCMIHLLARAGHLKEAQELLARMPFQPNAAIWGSILSASSIHGNVKVAQLALSHLVKLEPHNSGNYSLLSNTYSSLGKWNESRMVRKAMRDTGIKKMPGGSFIEVDNKLHEFISGGTVHPHSNRLFQALYYIDNHLRMAELFHDEWCELLNLNNF